MTSSDLLWRGTSICDFAAWRRRLIATAKPIVDDMIVQAGFWVGTSLYNRVLREVGE